MATEIETGLPRLGETGPAVIRSKRPPIWTRMWDSTVNLRSSVIGMVGFSMVAFWIIVAIFAPWIQRYDPNAQVTFPMPKGATILDLPPGSFPSDVPYKKDNPATPQDDSIPGYIHPNARPSSDAWLGTDDRGRDVFSRLVAGTRPVLTIAPISILIGATAGILLGLAAGYFGKWTDETLMRLLDAIIAFPTILIFLLIVSSFGPSRITVVCAIALAAVPGVARLARAMALDIRNRDYVASARLRGESSLWIMTREILPNAKGPILIDLTLRIAYAIFAIATLGFLGLGLPPTTPDWGTNLSQARSFITDNPWAAIGPAAAIASLVVGLNLMADGIRQEGMRYR
jgi:peptide/nickel transport system permease protein